MDGELVRSSRLRAVSQPVELIDLGFVFLGLVGIGLAGVEVVEDAPGFPSTGYTWNFFWKSSTAAFVWLS